MLTPEPTIDCVDCGGRCHLLTTEGPWEPGDIVAYRCEDCRDRWDLVLPDLVLPDEESPDDESANDEAF